MKALEETSIFVAGHNGMLGKQLIKRLLAKGYTVATMEREELDLTNQQAVYSLFKSSHFDIVINAAARVGGIEANRTLRREFLFENLMIQSNILHAAYQTQIPKLITFGSACTYPITAPQPLTEESLGQGVIEKTNEAYGLSKLVTVKLAEYLREDHGLDYTTLVPTNMYGPEDNFHPEHSHVIPALIKKFHEAKLSEQKSVKLWGSGKPIRDFLFVDDCVDAILLMLGESKQKSHLNVGSGTGISIKDLAYQIKECIQYEGTIEFDQTMPDGAMKKVLDTQKISAMGWKPKTSLREGLATTYDWYLANQGASIDSIRHGMTHHSKR